MVWWSMSPGSFSPWQAGSDCGGVVDFTTLLTLLYAEEKHPVTLNHFYVFAGAAGYEIINLSLHRPAYQWSNEEVRFFWALIYDLVESVSDGWDVACVAARAEVYT